MYRIVYNVGVKIDVYIKYVKIQSLLCMYKGLVAVACYYQNLRIQPVADKKKRLTFPRINTSVKSLEALCSNGTTMFF